MSSEYEPITKELRYYVTLLHDKGSAARARLGEMCDNIDAIHVGLERENKRLREELARVLGEQDTWESIISDATALGAQMGHRTTQIDDLVARCKALAGGAE